jgi:hypothetical protein
VPARPPRRPPERPTARRRRPSLAGSPVLQGERAALPCSASGLPASERLPACVLIEHRRPYRRRRRSLCALISKTATIEPTSIVPVVNIQRIIVSIGQPSAANRSNKHTPVWVVPAYRTPTGEYAGSYVNQWPDVCGIQTLISACPGSSCFPALGSFFINYAFAVAVGRLPSNSGLTSAPRCPQAGR